MKKLTREEKKELLQAYDLNAYENLKYEVKVAKETEKAIAYETEDAYGKPKFNWIPKSVAKIENGVIIALKGWFIDKHQQECGDYRIVSAEGSKRFEIKMS